MSFVTIDDDGSQPLTSDELAQLMNYFDSHGHAAQIVKGENDDIDFADQFLQQTEFLVNQSNNNNFNEFGQLIQNNPETGNTDFFNPQFQNFQSQPQMMTNNQMFQQPQNNIFLQQQYNNQQMFVSPPNPGFIMQSGPIPVFGQTIKQEHNPNSLSSSQEVLQPPKKQQRVNSTPSTPMQNPNIPQTPPQLQPVANQPRPAPVVPESSQLLARLQQALSSQHDQISQMRQIQKQVLLNPQKESFELLNNQQENLKKNLDAEIKALNDAIQNTVLQPHEVRKAFHLHQELLIQSMQLELYHQELGQLLLQPGMPTRCYVALVITEQPFPAVIRQNKPMEDPVVVTLLTGANVNLQNVSPVKILVNIDASQPKGTSNKSVENETENFDEMQKNSKFHCKFLVGSRKGIATVKFSANVQLSGGPMLTLESNLSNPFVIITNECQYEESDGILLKATAFGTQNDAVVAYPFFANLLQRHFLRGTKQDPVKPQRFLSKSELTYLNQKFFNSKQVITAKMYDDFWAWFGKGLQKLRYQRHLLPMWQSGLIYGFISREGVNALLVNQEVGTFLIRFSERHPGTFAIGYVIDDTDPEKRVRHYLIRPEDVSPPKKLLPDFLMECPQFSRFLQVSYDLQTGTPKHRIIDKEIVLEPYGAKVPTPEQPVNGYDPSLVNANSRNNNSASSPGMSNAAEYQLFTSD